MKKSHHLISLNNIKDYNSSDIVQKGKRYYGFSFKRKKNKRCRPTLINKPITGKKWLLKDFISEQGYEHN